MAITVKTAGALRHFLGRQREMQAEGATVGEVLEHLDIRDRLYDDTGKPRRICNIYVNDEDMRLLQGLETPVKEGDTVTLTAAIAGG